MHDRLQEVLLFPAMKPNDQVTKTEGDSAVSTAAAAAAAAAADFEFKNDGKGFVNVDDEDFSQYIKYSHLYGFP